MRAVRILAVCAALLGCWLPCAGSDDLAAGDSIESLHDLAVVRTRLADYGSARALAGRGLEIAERQLGPDDPWVARLLVDLARVDRLVGDFPEARPRLDRALAIQERALGPTHLETATTLRDLAELLRLSGDYAAAAPLFDRALAIRESQLGPDSIQVADVLAGMAILLRRVGVGRDNTCPEALPVSQRALAIAERTLGPDHPDLAEYLEGMGWTTVQCTGDNARGIFDATPYFERSLALLERAFGPDHVAEADSLEGLAYTAYAQGRQPDAVRFYRRKVEVERRWLGEDNPAVGFTLFRLAHAEMALRSQDAAAAPPFQVILEHALESERINREHARRTSRALPEREALHFTAARWQAGLDLALYLAAEGKLDADGRRMVWDALVRSRALAFDTMAARRRALLESPDPEVVRLAEAARQARSELTSIAVRPGATPQALEAARSAADAAERALAARSHTYAEEYEQSHVGADEVLARLPAGTALISYWVYYHWPEAPLEQYLAFVVRPGDTAPSVVRLGAREEIDQLATEWRKKAAVPPREGAEAASRAAGARLRRAVWDPLGPYLGEARQVLIIPAGQLHTVPFAALPVGKDRYLVDQPAVLHYLSAERDLVSPAATGGKGSLVLGGPAFEAHTRTERDTQGAAVFRGARSACESFAKMRFPPLPESAREARALAELSRKVDLLVGPEASETAFKRRAPGHRFLHLATHGFFLGGACEAPADPVTRSLAAENPLLLSGLALAGANRRAAAGPDEDDGILTAEEIAALDLSSVEWAVLSACDTGSGDVRAGEGVLGLQRAFRIAGARAVVMSLWPVDDKGTRRFMQTLYRLRLQSGLDVAAAMQGAMRAALSERRRKGLGTDPFYWAGFVAAGATARTPPPPGG